MPVRKPLPSPAPIVLSGLRDSQSAAPGPELKHLMFQLSRDTGHRGIFAAYGTAGEDPFEVQALSGDIPGVNPGCREGASPARNPQISTSGAPY